MGEFHSNIVSRLINRDAGPLPPPAKGTQWWPFIIPSSLRFQDHVCMNNNLPLSASLEDYLEAIYHSRDENREARAKMITVRLGVSGASVTEACQQLREKGLINYEPYGAISLTPAGEKVAESVVFRHETLKDFFIEVLKVDPETADEGACKMEHVVSATIVNRMIKYTKYLRREGHLHAGEQSFAAYLKNKQA